MKKLKKTAAFGLAAAMCASMALPAFAGSTNVATAGGTTTFDKYLVMDESANVPVATFNYTIAAGTAKAYDVDGHEVQVLAGVGTPTISNGGAISFSASDTTILEANKEPNDLVKNLEEGQKYAKKTATVDFTGCSFPEPGIYRYVITESGTNQGVTNDSDLTRYLDVYVVNSAADENTDATTTLSVLGYVLHADDSVVGMGGDNGSDGTDPTGKKQGFTNTYATESLYISKTVKGNQASADKYFEITVDISDAVVGTVYGVNLTGADATSATNSATIAANSGKTNPAEITVGAGGKVTQKFYLQGGQYIEISGLAPGTQVSVVENEEDYQPSVEVSGDATANVEENGADVVINATTTEDNEVRLTNTRQGAIPTGVIVSFLPYAALIGLGVLGFAVTKNKKEEKPEA